VRARSTPSPRRQSRVVTVPIHRYQEDDRRRTLTSPASPFLHLGPCPPPPDLEGRLPGCLHEEKAAPGVFLHAESLPPARTAALPTLALLLSRSAPTPALTGDPAPTARPSSHRRTAAAPTCTLSPYRRLLPAAWAQGMNLPG
jgi:hypothetical protein